MQLALTDNNCRRLASTLADYYEANQAMPDAEELLSGLAGLLLVTIHQAEAVKLDGFDYVDVFP